MTTITTPEDIRYRSGATVDRHEDNNEHKNSDNRNGNNHHSIGHFY